MAFLSAWHLAYAGISVFLVLFGGTMSGLTLGLMSLDLVELEVLQRSGTSQEKKQADAILPVVQKQHELLVTLLLCNAIAMEALPIFLDKLFHPVVAVVLSVTFVLAFGEILPQALCSRYGLAIGANLVWLVRILMILSFPIAYPVGKLLDYLLGHNDAGMFRRAQLKAFVSIHGKEEGKGGELSHDETTIISGALDLTLKIAEEAMTPIESTFSLDVESKLNWETMGKILATGHSRVPVYSGNPRNIIGLLLVKSLLTVRAEAETPVSAVSIRRIPRVPAGMPLYDILNEFQKGQSHMAAVVRRNTDKKHAQMGDRQDAASIMQDSKGGISEDEVQETTRNEVKDVEVQLDIERGQIETKYIVQVDDTKKNIKEHPNDSTGVSSKALDDLEDGEVIGIITLEDVIEELLQEEIVDETDEYVDVHKRIRVAAAAASATSRSPSIQRVGSSRVVRHASFLQGHKRKPENSSKPERLSSSKADSITQPLLEKK